MPCPAGKFVAQWGPQEKSKKYGEGGIVKLRWGVTNITKFQGLSHIIKFKTNQPIFAKTEKDEHLTFLLKLVTLTFSNF